MSTHCVKEQKTLTAKQNRTAPDDPAQEVAGVVLVDKLHPLLSIGQIGNWLPSSRNARAIH